MLAFLKTKTNEISNFKKYTFAVLIVLCPILNNYLIFGNFSIAEVVLFLMILGFGIDFFVNNYKLKKNMYFIFYAYLVLVSLCWIVFYGDNGVNSSSFYPRFLRDIVFIIIIFFLAPYYFDKKVFLKIFTVVALVLSIIMIIQALLFLFFNIKTILLVPFLKLNMSSDIYTIANGMMANFRPASLFLEPAQFAQFTAPAIIMNMFQERKIKLKSIVMLLSIIFSTSAIGIAFVVTILFVYFVFSMKGRFSVGVRILAAVFFLILCVLIYNVFNLHFLDEITGRFLEIFANDKYTSGNVRVVRGFLIFDELVWFGKLFGVGHGLLYNYKGMFGFDIALEIATVDYMSSISYVLVSGGIIGLILFCIPFIQKTIKSFKESEYGLLCMLIVFSLLMISSFIILSTTYFIYLLIIFNYYQKEEV